MNERPGTGELVRLWAEGWTAHAPDVLASIFTPDCVYEDVTLGLVHHGQEDRLRRTSEGWKISRREQTVLWVDGNSAVLSF